MKKLIPTIFIALAMFSSGVLSAQCADGESSVQIVIDTDDWGYEMYWELVPLDQTCGSAPVFLSGGNMDVGCDGDGAGASEGQAYANNQIFVSDIVCIATGSQVDLIHVDSYGDGGSDFTVLIDDMPTQYLDGGGYGDVFTIDVTGNDLIEYDMPCDAAEVLTDGTPIQISSVGATSSYSEIAPTTYGCNTPGAWCELDASVSVWATFTAEEGINYIVSSCNDGTNFDTQIAVWVADDCGDWSSFVLKGANDDAGCGIGNSYASACYTSCMEAGTQVLIQIDGWYGSNGIVELTVEASDVEPVIGASVHNISCALETDFNPDGYINMYSYYGGLDWDATWTGPFGYTGSGLNIDGLLPGVYNVEMVSNCSGAILSGSYIIVNPEPLELDVVVTSSCENGSGGSLDLQITGGTGDMDIDWDGPESFDWDDEDISAAETGWYNVEVIDGNGCSADMDVEVPFVGITPFSLGADFEMCAGDTEFFFGPVGNYAYQWQDGSTGQFYILDTEDEIATTAVVGVSVSNDYGCEVTDAVVISIVNCALSTSDIALENEWSISPNPMLNSATLNLSGVSENSLCRVRDGSGRIVMSFEVTDKMQLDVSDMSSGIYLVEILGERGAVVWNTRAIVQ
ncbi:MAG: T9SS type A sorting domain-containing protein [Flavobacteriales bacterium]|nr:T9SS type A sorting domain-containing protein [Flavobacteriales bacterium]